MDIVFSKNSFKCAVFKISDVQNKFNDYVLQNKFNDYELQNKLMIFLRYNMYQDQGIRFYNRETTGAVFVQYIK